MDPHGAGAGGFLAAPAGCVAASRRHGQWPEIRGAAGMAVVDDQDGYEPVKSVDLENGAGAKDASVPAPAKLKVLMFDLSGLPPMVQLLLLTSGVFLFFILCGSLEENMFNNVNGFTFGWYMTVFELLGFALTAALERRAAGEQVFEHRAPLVNHVIVAVSMTFARGLTNMSLQYLNYPSQVIFKSLKLIVVLIGSIVIYKKRFVRCGYLHAAILTPLQVPISGACLLWHACRVCDPVHARRRGCLSSILMDWYWRCPAQVLHRGIALGYAYANWRTFQLVL